MGIKQILLVVVVLTILSHIVSSSGSSQPIVYYATPTKYYNFTSLTNTTGNYQAILNSYQNENYTVSFNFWTDDVPCDPNGLGLKTQACIQKIGGTSLDQLGDPNLLEVTVFNESINYVFLNYRAQPETPCYQSQGCTRSILWKITCDNSATTVQNVVCNEPNFISYQCLFNHSSACLIDNTTTPSPTPTITPTLPPTNNTNTTTPSPTPTLPPTNNTNTTTPTQTPSGSSQPKVYYLTPTKYYNFTSLTNTTGNYQTILNSYQNEYYNVSFNFWTDDVPCVPGLKTQACSQKIGTIYLDQLGDPNLLEVAIFNESVNYVYLKYRAQPETPCYLLQGCIRSISWKITCDNSATTVQNVVCNEPDLLNYQCSFNHSSACLIDNTTTPSPTPTITPTLPPTNNTNTTTPSPTPTVTPTLPPTNNTNTTAPTPTPTQTPSGSSQPKVYYLTPTKYYNFTSLTNTSGNYQAILNSYQNENYYVTFNFWTDDVPCDPTLLGLKTQTCAQRIGGTYLYQLGDPNLLEVAIFNESVNYVYLKYTLPPRTPCYQYEDCINTRSILWNITCDNSATTVQNVVCYEPYELYYQCFFKHSSACLIDLSSNNTTPSPTPTITPTLPPNNNTNTTTPSPTPTSTPTQTPTNTPSGEKYFDCSMSKNGIVISSNQVVNCSSSGITICKLQDGSIVSIPSGSLNIISTGIIDCKSDHIQCKSGYSSCSIDYPVFSINGNQVGNLEDHPLSESSASLLTVPTTITFTILIISLIQLLF